MHKSVPAAELGARVPLAIRPTATLSDLKYQPRNKPTVKIKPPSPLPAAASPASVPSSCPLRSRTSSRALGPWSSAEWPPRRSAPSPAGGTGRCCRTCAAGRRGCLCPHRCPASPARGSSLAKPGRSHPKPHPPWPAERTKPSATAADTSRGSRRSSAEPWWPRMRTSALSRQRTPCAATKLALLQHQPYGTPRSPTSAAPVAPPVPL
mmetsp:Transcript_26706/g.71096  ORF Transcript_26706/g.71096 Transcript_26706/m.71096 type:complete len:208 (+) Transcript_26706:36-659(+)